MLIANNRHSIITQQTNSQSINHLSTIIYSNVTFDSTNAYKFFAALSMVNQSKLLIRMNE